MLIDLYWLGDFFGLDKKWDLAEKMYERSIALADTLHYDLDKVDAYFRILSMYFRRNEYLKGLQYLLGRQEMLDYLNHLGYAFYIGQMKAIAFSKENRLDSALHYFVLAEPAVLERGSKDIQYEFWSIVRRISYPPTGLFQSDRLLQEGLSNEGCYRRPGVAVDMTDTLRRLYERVGDYRGALIYNQLASEQRDSLRAKTQETELMKLEVETENRRKERLAREEELNTERRHNIQYMGFTVGLVLLFISIVVLGRFSVPSR